MVKYCSDKYKTRKCEIKIKNLFLTDLLKIKWILMIWALILYTSIDLNNINLDDNFDEDDLENNHVRLMASDNRFKQSKGCKKSK